MVCPAGAGAGGGPAPAAGAAPRTLSFRANTNYPCAGSEPRVVAAGDLDGDGHTDVVASGADPSDPGGVLCVWLNHGDGTFSAPVVHALGKIPWAVVIADLDGDGRGDIAIGNRGTGSVTVLLNDGTAGFAAAVDYDTGDLGPTTLTVADLNGDGRPDLGIADRDAGIVSAFFNKGDGTFGAAVTLTAADALAVGDLDGDGLPDLVVLSGTKGVGRMLNLGAGTFTAPLYMPYEIEPTLIAAGDLNRDGLADLVMGGSSGVGIFLNMGDGTFVGAAGISVPGSSTINSVALGDLNGDGVPDLEVTRDDGTFMVALNRGNGALLDPGTYAAGSEFPALAVGDLDGDGFADLAVTSQGGMGVFLNDGHGAFGPLSDVADPALQITAGDLNGDGSADLVLAGSSMNVSVLLGKGDGAFARPWSYFGGSMPAATAIGDLNGDCQPDIAVAVQEDGNVGVVLNKGDGTFAPADLYPIHALFASAIVAADLNGDRRLDLAVSTPDTLHVLINKGGGVFAPSVDYPGGGPALALADLNGDGAPDLAATNLLANSVTIFVNAGDGTLAPLGAYSTGISPDLIALGDVNGDGAPDLVTGSRYTAQIDVHLNAGDGSFGGPSSYAVGPDPGPPADPTRGAAGAITGSIALSDLNGDGQLDIAVVSMLTQDVYVLLNDGTGRFAPSGSYGAGASPRGLVLQDLNADGLPDMAITSLAGRVAVLLNTSR